jgi:predicted nucleic acid-binding protein
VTRYVLDTNIISNVTKPRPSPTLLAWLAAQNDDDLFVSALTIGEIRQGILEKPAGKKRSALGSVLNKDSIWNWTVIQASQRKGGLNGKAGLLAQRCGMAAD